MCGSVICSHPDVLGVSFITQNLPIPGLQPKYFLLHFPLMSSTCLRAVVVAAWTDSVPIPGPAASLRAWVLSWQLLVLSVVYNDRVERCLRLRFSIFIVSQSTKTACPYLGLDNQSTQPGQFCEYEYFSGRFTNNALSTNKICTVNISKVYWVDTDC